MPNVEVSTRPQAVRRSVGLVIASGVLLGTAGTAAAFAPDDATPVVLGTLRLAAGAVALLAFLPLLGGAWRNLPRLVRRPTIWLMAAGAAGYQPLFFGGVDRSGVALRTLVPAGSAPVFAGLLGWAVLHHKPTAAWVGATGLAIVGLLLRSWGSLSIGDGLGLAMAAGAGLCSAVYVIAAKVELDRGGHVVELPGVAYLLGAVMLMPLLIGQPLGWIATPSGVGVVIYLGLVTMGIANVFQVWGLRGLPPGPAATLLLADPITATVLGVLILGETIPPLGIVGLTLVLIGLLLQGRALGVTKADTPDLEPAL